MKYLRAIYIIPILFYSLSILASYNNISNNNYVEPNQKNTTINLMWIGKGKEKNNSILPKSSTSAKSIRSDFTRQDTTLFLDKILDIWAEKNPGITINLWYDSNLLTENAVSNTLSLIKNNCKHTDRINLKDIRDLEFVKNFSDSFSPDISLYVRLDLLRMIAGYETVNMSQTPINFVYTDFSVEPMSWKDLMDEETKETLNKFGFVMAKAQHGGGEYENFFFIMSNQNKEMMKAIRTAFIENGLYHIYFFKNLREYSRLEDQTIFSLYSEFMFPVFYALTGQEYAMIFHKQNKKSYPPDFPVSKDEEQLHNNLNEWFNPLNNNGWSSNIKIKITNKAKEEKEIKLDKNIYKIKRLFIPTKPYPNEGKWPISHFTKW